MNKIYLVVLVSLFAVSLVSADSGWSALYSGLVAPGSEHPQIEMAAEWVDVELGDDNATVNAVFHFVNNGPATEVEMIFPLMKSTNNTQFDYAYADEDRQWHFKSTLENYGLDENTFHIEREIDSNLSSYNSQILQEYKNFKIFVDGIKTDYKLLEVNDQSKDYTIINSDKFTRWRVPFEKGEKKEVVCKYVAPYNQERHGMGPHCFEYVLYTGADWHGSIGKGVITITNTTDSAIWFTTPDKDSLDPAKVSVVSGNDVIEYTFENYEPSSDCQITVALGQGLGSDTLEYIFEKVNLPQGKKFAGKTLIKMNFRSEPDSGSAKVAEHPKLGKDTHFEVLGGKGEWWQVKLGDGTVGWLRWRYVDPDTSKENIYAELFPGVGWGA